MKSSLPTHVMRPLELCSWLLLSQYCKSIVDTVSLSPAIPTLTTEWCNPQCRHRPRDTNPLRDGLVWSQHSPSSRTLRNQYALVNGRCSDVAAVVLTCFRGPPPTSENMTSSIQPEVYNVSQHHHNMMTKPRSLVTGIKKLKFDVQFRRCASGRHRYNRKYITYCHLFVKILLLFCKNVYKFT